MKLDQYKTLIFDCDGVILNSNKLKTNGFYDFAYFSGEENAKKLVDYHIRYGGVSRYEKIKFFYTKLLKIKLSKKKLISEADRYSKIIQDKLLKCEVAPFLKRLKKINNKSNWVVVSGSDQVELRKTLQYKKLNYLFDDNIFGSPLNKEQIISEKINNNIIKLPAIFIGDSEYDFKTALNFRLDFIYLSEWSEWTPSLNINLKYKFKNIKELFLESQKPKDLI